MTNEINPCYKRQQEEAIVFPAKVFGYLAMCENVKRKVQEVVEESEVVFGDLPFVSSMTNQFSPQAAVHMHWSFLKY